MPSPKTKQRQATARTRRTANSRTTTGGGRSGFPGVLGMLKEEHDLVKELFDRFEKETEENPADGKATADEICMELTRHAEMEEKLIYPALKTEDEDIFYEAQEEHHVAKVLIAEIEAMKPDPVWRAKVTVLAESVRHHIEEEETEGFPELKNLGTPKLDELGKQWDQMKASWKPTKARSVA
jgi:hemerythrin-like domain-containing protein